MKESMFVLFVLLSISYVSFGQKVIYWQSGDDIYNNSTAKADIINRGFTHLVLRRSSDSEINWFHHVLPSNNIEVILALHASTPTTFSLKKENPFGTDATAYQTKYNSLQSFLQNVTSNLCGIVDDIEVYPFNKITYSADGSVASSIDYYDIGDSRNRIFNSGYNSRVSFVNYPSTNSHYATGLTMDNIEFNFPQAHANAEVSDLLINKGFLFGWYGMVDTISTAGNYHRVSQTFEISNSYITKIDIKIKRFIVANNSIGGFPDIGYFKYFLTETTTSGSPDLTKKKGSVYYVKSDQIDYLGTNQDDFGGIDYTSLYFDPADIGSLDVSKQYALVLEFGQSDYENFEDDWNGCHYRVAAAVNAETDPYTEGQLFKGHVDGSWALYSDHDLCFKVYYPNPPSGYGLNQFHNDWITFQVYNMRKVIREYEDAIGTRSIDLYLYSGYQDASYYGQSIMERYTADWSQFWGNIDYAICGYGQINTSATTSALNGIPLIGGAQNQSDFTNRYNACNGGAMYWYSGGYSNDGGISVVISKAIHALKGQNGVQNFKLTNYPNPFNPVTNITYSLPEKALVSLKIYDMLGCEVAELVNDYTESGSYTVDFNGSTLASGMYIVSMKAGDFSQTRKILLMK